MPNESLLPILWEDKVNSPELEAWFAQFGVTGYLNAEQINQLRDAINELFFNGGGSTGGGNIKPTSISIQYTGNATLQNIAAAINAKAIFTVLPGQLPVFYAYSTLDKPTFRVLFKGLGAGIYGAGSFTPGEEVVKASTLQVISQTQASFQELEAMEGTQTINFGEIGSANPWTVLNAKNPKVFIQNYAVGNRLIKTLVSGVSVNYLFLGAGGDYGVGGLQSVAADFSIQSAEIVPIDISGKEDKINKGAANGYAPLGADKKVPAVNLPAPNEFIITENSEVLPEWINAIVIIKGNITLTVPASGLPLGFNFDGIVDVTRTLTWAITTPKVWKFGTPYIMPGKTIFTFYQERANTNNIYLLS